jgi:hypothetical protein
MLDGKENGTAAAVCDLQTVPLNVLQLAVAVLYDSKDRRK